MGSILSMSLPRSSSPVGLSPRKSSLKRSGSVDGPDRDGSRRGSSGSNSGQRKSDADARRTSLRKGSLDRKGSTQSVEERRRVSFPENERDYLGEADWDYDRTPIEVDFDSCFSKCVGVATAACCSYSGCRSRAAAPRRRPTFALTPPSVSPSIPPSFPPSLPPFLLAAFLLAPSLVSRPPLFPRQPSIEREEEATTIF